MCVIEGTMKGEKKKKEEFNYDKLGRYKRSKERNVFFYVTQDQLEATLVHGTSLSPEPVDEDGDDTMMG